MANRKLIRKLKREEALKILANEEMPNPVFVNGRVCKWVWNEKDKSIIYNLVAERGFSCSFIYEEIERRGNPNSIFYSTLTKYVKVHKLREKFYDKALSKEAQAVILEKYRTIPNAKLAAQLNIDKDIMIDFVKTKTMPEIVAKRTEKRIENQRAEVSMTHRNVLFNIYRRDLPEGLNYYGTVIVEMPQMKYSPFDKREIVQQKLKKIFDKIVDTAEKRAFKLLRYLKYYDWDLRYFDKYGVEQTLRTIKAEQSMTANIHQHKMQNLKNMKS